MWRDECVHWVSGIGFILAIVMGCAMVMMIGCAPAPYYSPRPVVHIVAADGQQIDGIGEIEMNLPPSPRPVHPAWNLLGRISQYILGGVIAHEVGDVVSGSQPSTGDIADGVAARLAVEGN